MRERRERERGDEKDKERERWGEWERDSAMGWSGISN